MKYELLIVSGRVGFRLRAFKDFSDVKKGDLGGWVQHNRNLSQEGDCWIYDNAKVFDNAEVFDNAKVSGNAEIADNAKVSGCSKVSGDTQVYGDTIVIDSKVSGKFFGDILIIPKDHPDFWDYRLAHPDLEVIYLDK